MSYVVTLGAFTPPPRYDSLAWTKVRVEESTSPTGSWTLIDTITLSPVDADPSLPAQRSVTTEEATLVAGWYRIQFEDLNGDFSPYSDPVTAGQKSAVQDRVRSYIPVTWDAMLHASVVGPNLLAMMVQDAQYRLFMTVVDPTLEASVYDPWILGFAAKYAALRVIPAGADFWSDQAVNVNARDESVSYPDRINALWKVHGRLLAEVREDTALFRSKFPDLYNRRKGNVPAINTEGPFMTPHPDNFGSGHAGIEFGRETYHGGSYDWSEWR